MRRRPGALVLAAVLWSGLAPAESPEAEWGTLPSGAVAPVTPPPPPPPSALSPQAWPPPTRAPVASAPAGFPPPVAAAPPVWQPELPNTVSMLGAPTLGPGARGQLALVGFPLLSLRAAFGLARWLDVGVGFDSFYGAMNEPRASLRFGLLPGGPWTVSLALEGGYAFFAQSAAREVSGPRAFTGRRNVNASPALVASYSRSPGRSPRLFFELRYLLAVDLEPVVLQPLGGAPPAFILGHNGGLRGGVELPLSTTASFVFLAGVELHGRADDLPAVPGISVGVVTGL